MLLINCPYCGPRPELEFSYGGQAHIARPAEPAFQVTSIHNTLSDVHQLLAPELEKKGIQLSLLEVDPVPVKIDSEQIDTE